MGFFKLKPRGRAGLPFAVMSAPFWAGDVGQRDPTLTGLRSPGGPFLRSEAETSFHRSDWRYICLEVGFDANRACLG